MPVAYFLIVFIIYVKLSIQLNEDKILLRNVNNRGGK